MTTDVVKFPAHISPNKLVIGLHFRKFLNLKKAKIELFTNKIRLFLHHIRIINHNDKLQKLICSKYRLTFEFQAIVHSNVFGFNISKRIILVGKLEGKLRY